MTKPTPATPPAKRRPPKATHNIVPALARLAVPVDSLQLLEDNPNVGDVEAVARSLARFGQRKPITAQPDGTVTAGNTTLRAAISLGWSHVAAVPTDDDAATALAWSLADNHSADLGAQDDHVMLERLLELQAADAELLEAASFFQDDIDDLLRRLADDAEEEGAGFRTDPDSVPSSAPAITEAGDVWKLGDHRLVCGDATDPAVVASVCPAGEAHAVWTDPPYNVAIEGKAGAIGAGRWRRRSVLNDDLSADEFGRLLAGALAAAHTVLTPGGAIYVAHADSERVAFTSAFVAAGFHLSGVIIWRKHSLVLGRSDYQWQHEPILYGWKLGAAHRWLGTRKQTTLVESTDSPFLQQPDGSWQILAGDRILVVSGDNLSVVEHESTVHEHDRPTRSDDHPTTKPVDLIARHLRNSTRPGEVVVDLFGGSGSTLVAAHTLGRVARLVELDPRFCDVICRRFQELTGIVPIHQRSRRRVSFLD